MTTDSLREYLEEKADYYNTPAFIPDDPIAIPHEYSKLQDIEITGFWVAVLAWGQRKTILNKARELFSLMDNAPFDFIMNHTEKDLKPLLSFKHRTFNAEDTLYFIAFFRHYFSTHSSLEEAFGRGIAEQDDTVENGLKSFHESFFDLPYAPGRTRKHVATPARNSACKRINMFLRWMVRKDDRGVDFGLWNTISPSQLVCPCDVHVDRVARRLGLITRKQTDWQTALQLTEQLRLLDPVDPVRYDFALFGLGLEDRGA